MDVLVVEFRLCRVRASGTSIGDRSPVGTGSVDASDHLCLRRGATAVVSGALVGQTDWAAVRVAHIRRRP